MLKNENGLGKDIRVKTGISGFDEFINGGIPEGNIVLVSGAAGTGKSLFALEFIYYGAKEFNEPGVYITLEEFADRIIVNAGKLGFMDIPELIEEGRMGIIRTEVFNIEKLVGVIEDLIDQYDAKRVSIDSISALSAFAEKPYQVRRTILELANMLKRQKVTAVFTCGVSSTTEGHFGVSIEEYAVDGIITLFHKVVGTQFIRAMGVVKMRGTAHSENLHPVIIKNGLVILKDKTFPEDFRV